MRWNLTPRAKPGDKRIVTRFAFFPIRIENTLIWLENYEEEQEYGLGGAWWPKVTLTENFDPVYYRRLINPGWDDPNGK